MKRSRRRSCGRRRRLTCWIWSLENACSEGVILSGGSLMNTFEASDLKPGKCYLASNMEAPPPLEDETEDDETSGGEVEALVTPEAEDVAVISSEEAPAPAPASASRKRVRDAAARSVKRIKRSTTSLAIEEVNRSLKQLLSKQHEQGEELKSQKQEISGLNAHVHEQNVKISGLNALVHEQEQQISRLNARVSVLEAYQLTGTTPLAAACSLSEFAGETASFFLRRRVAKEQLELLELSRSKHEKSFRKLFGSKFYIEDINFPQAALWDYNATKMSLSDYWRSRGFIAEKPLCKSWNEPPTKKNGFITKELQGHLHAAAEDLAKELGVRVRDLQLFLRLYATVRHERNDVAHFFSVYTKPKHTEPAEIKFPSVDACKARLEAALKSEHKVLKLEDLKCRLWVIQRVMEEVEQLEWFKDHAAVFRAFGSMLVSLFPGFVADSVNAADAKEAEKFGFVVHEHFSKSSALFVEKHGGGRFRYPEKSQSNRVWEQEIARHQWTTNVDAWKVFLGV